MSELEAWLKLWHIPKIGPKTFNFLLTKFPKLEELFASSLHDLIECGIPKPIAETICDDQNTQYYADLAWLRSNKNHQITLLNQASYPDLLKQIYDPPPILYSLGNIELFNAELCLSIVGGRTASSSGKKIAFDFAQSLASIGITVVSGLARGVDRHAHEGAISCHNSSTIAVLGNGLDSIYPKEHNKLASKIAENSLIISEFAPKVQPLAKHFPRRNRIISGLCMGVIVIEAAQRSGSLITAKYALEQGREVFAVPGPISNPNYAGSHMLIQEGAKLTTHVDDILKELSYDYSTKRYEPNMNSSINHQYLSDEVKQFLSFIDYIPMSMEEIIEKSGLTPERVSSMLTELELGGHVAADAIGLYSRIQ